MGLMMIRLMVVGLFAFFASSLRADIVISNGPNGSTPPLTSAGRIMYLKFTNTAAISLTSVQFFGGNMTASGVTWGIRKSGDSTDTDSGSGSLSSGILTMNSVALAGGTYTLTVSNMTGQYYQGDGPNLSIAPNDGTITSAQLVIADNVTPAWGDRVYQVKLIATQAVPEPGTLALGLIAILGGLSVVFCKRSKRTAISA